MLFKYFSYLAFTLLIVSYSKYPKTEYEHAISKNNLIEANKTEIDSCFFGGIPLKGKVKFVTSFPDIKVKFVSSFPDLKVKFVSSFPDDCGEWQVVESFPDFKIQVVESFPDLEIQVVESFPGIP